jgi:hypothetical protein
MAFSKTLEQMRARTKDITRRDGWLDAEPGEVVTAIEQGMGLKRGERQVVIGSIRIVSVRRERLGDITPPDCVREGFPDLSPAEFVAMYGRPADHVVTRIEFVHLDMVGCLPWRRGLTPAQYAAARAKLDALQLGAARTETPLTDRAVDEDRDYVTPEDVQAVIDAGTERLALWGDLLAILGKQRRVGVERVSRKQPLKG